VAFVKHILETQAIPVAYYNIDRRPPIDQLGESASMRIASENSNDTRKNKESAFTLTYKY
jgi:hypothetical protein